MSALDNLSKKKLDTLFSVVRKIEPIQLAKQLNIPLQAVMDCRRAIKESSFNKARAWHVHGNDQTPEEKDRQKASAFLQQSIDSNVDVKSPKFLRAANDKALRVGYRILTALEKMNMENLEASDAKLIAEVWLKAASHFEKINPTVQKKTKAQVVQEQKLTQYKLTDLMH